MTVSKAEKAAIALCAAFLLVFAGWFARGIDRAGYYEITTEHLPSDQVTAAPTQATFTPEVLVDLNAATLDDLTGLPGIGEAKAQAILDYRTAHGSFSRIEDIMKVKGIGEGIFQQLEPYVTVNSPEGGQKP